MTRKDYQHHIWVYEQRRKKLYQKIRTWRKAIKRIDGRNALIDKLIKTINDYFEVDIKNKKGGGKLNIARNIYYKYGMETGMCGKFLEEAIGRPRNSASKSRLTFTRSFRKNKANKTEYHKFLDYMKNNF